MTYSVTTAGSVGNGNGFEIYDDSNSYELMRSNVGDEIYVSSKTFTVPFGVPVHFISNLSSVALVRSW